MSTYVKKYNYSLSSSALMHGYLHKGRDWSYKGKSGMKHVLVQPKPITVHNLVFSPFLSVRFNFCYFQKEPV